MIALPGDAKNSRKALEAKLARITVMFHSGQVTLENARKAVETLNYGGDVSAIESTMIEVVGVLPNRLTAAEIKEQRDEAESIMRDRMIEDQGLQPRRRLSND